MPMRPREMCALLEKNKFELIGSNGSHRKYRHKETGVTVIVPYHAKELKKGTEESILKQAGLK